MHILITGAAGMIGRKLTARLVKDGTLNGAADRQADADRHGRAGARRASFSGKCRTRPADLAAPGVAEKADRERPEVIFHLAGVVSGEAETDFEKGYHVNLDGTRALLEAIRAPAAATSRKSSSPRRSRSSARRFRAAIPDDFHLTPLTSYGTQKAISELLLADYNRRGFLDGVGIRLPTICVRPGKPNKAASGFFSGIIREPLAGQEAVLPVADSVRHCARQPALGGRLPHPRRRADARAARHRASIWPCRASACTVAEQIEALRRVAGDKVAARIRREPDELIMRIVAGWPTRFDAQARARRSASRPRPDFDDDHPRAYRGRIGREDRG